jgi:hypothetical protein
LKCGWCLERGGGPMAFPHAKAHQPPGRIGDVVVCKRFANRAIRILTLRKAERFGEKALLQQGALLLQLPVPGFGVDELSDLARQVRQRPSQQVQGTCRQSLDPLL